MELAFMDSVGESRVHSSFLYWNHIGWGFFTKALTKTKYK